MKKIYVYLLGVILLLVSCEKDPIVTESYVSVVSEQVSATSSSLSIRCNIKSNVYIDEVYIENATAIDPYSYVGSKAMTKSGTSYIATLTGLKSNTDYYIRYRVEDRRGACIHTDAKKYRTPVVNLPTVTTSAVTNVGSTIATVGGNVTSDGGAAVTERGVVYSTSQNPTTSSSKKTSGSGTGSFSVSLSGLSEGTTYYIRAYAINSNGTSYGEQKSFTTGANLPSVTTSDPTNVSSTTATVGGNVTSDGGAAVTERGVVYSTSQNPTTSSSKKTSGSGTGSFSVSLSGLSEGTTYYIRAYAINSNGTSYGEQKSFTTGANLPSVTTSDPTNVSSTTATVGGNVTSDGGAAVTERGVVYSTSQNPTTSSSKKTSGSGTGSFSVSLSGLSKSTIYYVRAYAINSRGVSYGEQKSFATKNSSGSVNGYDYVDLGLSVKWATCNVGADSPEDYGDYFAWGETKPKSTYKWSTYEWCQGSTTTLTKYCTYSSYGKVDNKTQLDLSDDAARANWGGSWRMPTHDELTELREKCSWTGTTQNGVEGYKVTSKTNGNSIFLPAAGYRYVSSLLRAGSYGYYWSSSLCTDDPLYARYVDFDSSGVGWSDYGDRGGGQSVRPVCP